MAILLLDKDGAEIISAPVINEELYINFQIHGRMNAAEAAELSLLLRSGALAAPLEIVEERTVGPSLGADNIRRGINSVIGGFAAICGVYRVLLCGVWIDFGGGAVGEFDFAHRAVGGGGGDIDFAGFGGFCADFGDGELTRMF